MLTYDEALKSLLALSEGADEQTVRETQTEFLSDICSSPNTTAVSSVVITDALLTQFRDFPPLLDSAIRVLADFGKVCWLNGMSLGVCVGVRMERKTDL